jgi:protein-disulfide isomerase
MLLFAPLEAQNTPLLNSPLPGTSAPSLQRKIELLIRSQFSVSPEYEISLGIKGKSNVEGYDTLPVTFVAGDRRTTIDFLLSRDGSTLARLEKFDLNNNPSLAIDTSTRPVRGTPAAEVEIVSFDDLECPYCGMLNNEILPATMKHYQKLVKIVYQDYPLPNHPWALHAAVDANCLANQDGPAYWAYVDFVHSHGQEISGATPNPAKSFADLDNIADTFGAKNGVNRAQLAMCLKKQETSVVNQSLKLGNSLGVSATPQVFVDGERLPSGAQPIEKLWPAIDRALKARGIEPPANKANDVEHP